MGCASFPHPFFSALHAEKSLHYDDPFMGGSPLEIAALHPWKGLNYGGVSISGCHNLVFGGSFGTVFYSENPYWWYTKRTDLSKAPIMPPLRNLAYTFVVEKQAFLRQGWQRVAGFSPFAFLGEHLLKPSLMTQFSNKMSDGQGTSSIIYHSPFSVTE